MRTIVKSTLILAIAFFFWQCNKTEEPILKESDVITIKNTNEYVHDFNISGDEEGAIIKVQALHFEVSEITRNAITNWSVVYTYKPTPGYVGKDSVEIETCTGGGGIYCTEIEIVKLNFQITD